MVKTEKDKYIEELERINKELRKRIDDLETEQKCELIKLEYRSSLQEKYIVLIDIVLGLCSELKDVKAKLEKMEGYIYGQERN